MATAAVRAENYIVFVVCGTEAAVNFTKFTAMSFKFWRLSFPIIAIMFTSVFANFANINPYGFIRFNGVWSDGAGESSEPKCVMLIYGVLRI